MASALEARREGPSLSFEQPCHHLSHLATNAFVDQVNALREFSLQSSKPEQRQVTAASTQPPAGYKSPSFYQPLASHTCWLGALGRADGNDLIWIWLLLRRSTVLAEAIGDSRQWAAKNHAPLLRKPLATIRYGSRAEKQQRWGSSDTGHGLEGACIAARSAGRALCQWAAKNHEPLLRKPLACTACSS